MSSTSTSESEDSYERDEVKPLPKREYEKGYNLQAAIKNTKERMVPDCPLPSSHIPSDAEFWSSDKKPNADFIKSHLKQEGTFRVSRYKF